MKLLHTSRGFTLGALSLLSLLWVNSHCTGFSSWMVLAYKSWIFVCWSCTRQHWSILRFLPDPLRFAMQIIPSLENKFCLFLSKLSTFPSPTALPSLLNTRHPCFYFNYNAFHLYQSSFSREMEPVGHPPGTAAWREAGRSHVQPTRRP